MSLSHSRSLTFRGIESSTVSESENSLGRSLLR